MTIGRSSRERLSELNAGLQWNGAWSYGAKMVHQMGAELGPANDTAVETAHRGLAMNNTAQACESALLRRKANPITQTRPVPSRANEAGSGVGVGVIVSTPVSSFPVVKS